MSVDTINEALTDYRLAVVKHKDAYMDGGATRLAILSMMRAFLMHDSPDAFVDYVQLTLGSVDGDVMSDILDELFVKLNVKFWEEFEAILRA